MKPKILYITYDGLLEPLGQSQILGYMEHLTGEYDIHILSFEKQDDRKNSEALRAMHMRLTQSGIGWTPLAYHKTPSALATAFDIGHGIIVAKRLARKLKIDIIHARSYVPALIAIQAKKRTNAKFLFDMRGFWADERVDGGIWPRNGRLYRTTKELEGKFLRAANHIVTLTNASIRELNQFPALKGASTPITVIPTCANLKRFAPAKSLKGKPFTFGYVGSVGTWYLFDETLAFFTILLERKPEAHLLVVNRNEHDFIRKSVLRAGIPLDKLELVAATHDEVPSLINRMDVGAALIRPCFSKISSAPTKLAEYLGCGVPCLGNSGVGDMDEILEDGYVGVSLPDFERQTLVSGVDRLLALTADSKTPERCVAKAHELFSLKDGVARYSKIYASLSAN